MTKTQSPFIKLNSNLLPYLGFGLALFCTYTFISNATLPDWYAWTVFFPIQALRAIAENWLKYPADQSTLFTLFVGVPAQCLYWLGIYSIFADIKPQREAQ